MELKPWELLGPTQYILSAADVAGFLRISEKTLLRMIAAGQFPTPQMISGMPTWTGADVAAYLHLRGRVGSAERKDEDKTRQGKARKSQGGTIGDIDGHGQSGH